MGVYVYLGFSLCLISWHEYGHKKMIFINSQKLKMITKKIKQYFLLWIYMKLEMTYELYAKKEWPKF
jgi:hypothetical protein